MRMWVTNMTIVGIEKGDCFVVLQKDSRMLDGITYTPVFNLTKGCRSEHKLRFSTLMSNSLII